MGSLGTTLYDQNFIPEVVLDGIEWIVYNQSSNYKEKDMEKCPCKNCILLAMCIPRVLSPLEDPDEDEKTKTLPGLINKFIFDGASYPRKDDCVLLMNFLEVKTHVNDQGKTTYSIKTEKILEVAEALGFDMDQLQEEMK